MIDKYVLQKLSQNTDRIETVQFLSRLSETTFSSPYVLYRVKRNKHDQELQAGGDLMTMHKTTFRLYATDLVQAGAVSNIPGVASKAIPKTTDRIVTNVGQPYQTTWNVLGMVDWEEQDQAYVCPCEEVIV